MIKKLKRKLIFINMLLVAVILFSAFAGIYLITKHNLADRSSSAMREISQEYATKDRFSFYGENFLEDSEYGYLSTFAIETNDIARTFSINGYAVKQDDLDEDELVYLNKLIAKVYSVDNGEGLLADENLRFYSAHIDFGRRIIFLDKAYEDDTLRDLVLVFVWTSIITLAAFYGISVLFAQVSVAPIENSFEQQRQLIADASHELKTPITVISANADILASHPDDTIREQYKWIEYIKTETERMTSLIQNMLFLAKNDEGESKSVLSAVNMSDIVNAAALPFESICFEKNKAFTIEVAPEIFVMGDEVALRQLVAIFVDNACKYSDENGRIRVCLTDEQERTVLSVWNSGVPIPPEKLPHIFDRFFRVDKSRSRSEGGYGLGLAIAKTIADSHQAKLSVISNAENGTMFSCSFKTIKTPFSVKLPTPPKTIDI